MITAKEAKKRVEVGRKEMIKRVINSVEKEIEQAVGMRLLEVNKDIPTEVAKEVVKELEIHGFIVSRQEHGKTTKLLISWKI